MHCICYNWYTDIVQTVHIYNGGSIVAVQSRCSGMNLNDVLAESCKHDWGVKLRPNDDEKTCGEADESCRRNQA